MFLVDTRYALKRLSAKGCSAARGCRHARNDRRAEVDFIGITAIACRSRYNEFEGSSELAGSLQGDEN